MGKQQLVDGSEDVTLDTLLTKTPPVRLSREELRAVVEHERKARAEWEIKQKTKGKQE